MTAQDERLRAEDRGAAMKRGYLERIAELERENATLRKQLARANDPTWPTTPVKLLP